MKCNECEHMKFEQHNGSPNRFYCLHPKVVAGYGSRMICRTDRYSKELKVKTSPRWCPMKENGGNDNGKKN